MADHTDADLARPLAPGAAVTVDEFIRVFAAQRPDAEWVWAVEQFVPALNREQVTALLAALPRGDRRTRVQLVRTLAAHLDGAHVAELAAIVATTKGAGARLAALGCVVDRLPGAQRDDAVAAAARRAVKVPAEAEDLIAWAGPYLPPDDLVAVLRTVVTNPVPRRRYRTLGVAVARLPPAGLDEVLSFLPMIPEEPVRASAVGDLAPLLPPDRLGAALALARDIGDGISRAEALAGLVPHLPPAERAAAVRDALLECTRVRYPFQRPRVVFMLAPWLDRHQHDTVLDLVAGGDRSDVGLLGPCAPHLDTAQLDRALDLLSDRRLDHVAGGTELLAMRPYLSPAQRRRAVRDLLARMVRTGGWLDHASAVALAAFSGDLTAAQVDTVVETAALAYGSHHRAWLTTAVLSRLTSAQAARALQHALGIPEHFWRTPVLGDLFPRLDAGGRSRVVAAASAIDDPARRVAAVAAYIVHLPAAAQDPHIVAALTAAEAITEPHERAIVLADLAAAVPAPARDRLLRLAFTTAQAVDGRSRRVRALAAVGATITGTRPDRPAIQPAFPAGTATSTQ